MSVLLKLSLDFLHPGETSQATIITDGINANHHAEDYRVLQQSLTAKDKLSIRMVLVYAIVMRGAPSATCHYLENVGSAAEFYTTVHEVILDR